MTCARCVSSTQDWSSDRPFFLLFFNFIAILCYGIVKWGKVWSISWFRLTGCSSATSGSRNVRKHKICTTPLHGPSFYNLFVRQKGSHVGRSPSPDLFPVWISTDQQRWENLQSIGYNPSVTDRYYPRMSESTSFISVNWTTCITFSRRKKVDRYADLLLRWSGTMLLIRDVIDSSWLPNAWIKP